MKGIAVFFSLLVGGALSFKMTKIHKNNAPALTSSTLKWSPVSPGKAIPADSVPIVEGGPLWCMVEENGVHVPGAVEGTLCKAPFFSLLERPDFEVLVSINGSSRLVREPWDFQAAIPNNAISTPRMLLAYTEEGENILAGYVDPHQVSKRAFFAKDGAVVNRTKAMILTEVEPFSYTLHDIVINEISSQLKEKVFEEFTLENSGPTTETVSHQVKFNDVRRVYWGMGQGTILGLETTVKMPGENYGIKWGLRTSQAEHRSHLVEYELPPFSYVNVTVFGILREVSEATYFAALTSQYHGGLSPLSRNVTGLHTSTTFLELRANFSSTLSMENDTPLENSVPQLEILIHSTTTTTPAPIIESPHADKVGVNEGKNYHPAAVLLACSLMLLRAVH